MATTNSSTPPLELTSSRHFPQWLAEQRLSLAFTTYQAGKLFFVGLQASGQLSIFERTFNRCMGLCSHGNSLWMSSLYQLWRFENALEAGQKHQEYDCLFVPQVGYTTGDLDIHDIAVDAQGQVIFVNTLFSCLATLSETHSFRPIWHPPFISRLAAEDRCHLNGLALANGQPAYVTAVSQSDVADGWRDHRHKGGFVMDIQTNKIIVDGLSMPHSPRLHQDKLWLLEAGSGYLGWVDREKGQFHRLTFCPGYARGLSFIDHYAIVGLSKLRKNRTFADLELGEQLAAKTTEARCAIQVIDIRSGDIVHWLRIEGVVEELYDVVILQDIRRPMALGFMTPEIQHTITIGKT